MSANGVTLDDVRKQLTLLGYTNVPDQLVREFLEDINGTGTPADAESAVEPIDPPSADGHPTSPSTPARPPPARAQGSPLGPWAGFADRSDPPEDPVSPFDDPSRGYENFPPWPEDELATPPDSQRRHLPKSTPASPPFEMHGTPPQSRTYKLRGSPAMRVTSGRVPKKATKGKKVKKATAAQHPKTSGRSSRPASARAPPPASGARGQAVAAVTSPDTDTTPPPSTPPSSLPSRHVSGTGVIYSRMSTAKERANTRGLGFRKSDPVKMYQRHAKAWASDSFLRSSVPTALPTQRAAVREVERPRTAGSTPRRSVSSRKSTAAPTDNRRDQLRWQIRMQMASPPH